MTTPAQLTLWDVERSCALCSEAKPLAAFSSPSDYYCRACNTLRMREWRAKNRAQGATIPVEKLCTACRQTLPSHAFYRATGAKDGLQSCCKSCKDAQNKRWEQSHRNQRRAYRAAHHQAKWHHYRSLAKSWRKSNPLKDREYFYRYYGRKRGTRIGKVDFAAILERDNNTCYLCSLPISDSELHFDHVIPLSRGGAHTMDNIRAAHAHCNLSKSDKTPDEYFALRSSS